MKAIGFFVILFTILIANNEIKGKELRDPIQFDDKDFTDYEEMALLRIKREIELSDKPSIIILEYLNSTLEINDNQKVKDVSSLVKTRRKANSSNNETPVSLDSILRRIDIINSGKLKASLRNKRGATFTSLKSIEEEDTEVIFKRIEKLNPEKAKEIFLRNKREVHDNTVSPKSNNSKKMKRHTDLATQLHKLKVKEIMDFLEDHYLSTNYIYKEMQRIKKEGVVLDKLRRLAHYLEQKDHEVLRKSVLKCYYNSIVADKKNTINIWKDRVPNNLIIDPLKDNK